MYHKKVRAMMSNSSDLMVGIVDDSPLICQLIEKVVTETPGMRVAGIAHDPYEARQMIKEVNPDVITLDIEMPKMNGLEFLEKIMRLRPMPVIMVSTLTERGADVTIQALETGALDYVSKPTNCTAQDIIESFKTELVPKLEAVKTANVASLSSLKTNNLHEAVSSDQSIYDLIGIASSTGGVERLRYLISNIRINMPPMLIVQHINKIYVPGMIERMQEIAPEHIEIKIPTSSELLEGNTIYFANNIQHLEVKANGPKLRAKLHDEPPLNGFKASADYLFSSLAVVPDKKCLGVIISGMGNDGAKGLKTLHESGGMTLGESKESCLVYGMSRAAKEIGALDKEVSIQSISAFMNKS